MIIHPSLFKAYDVRGVYPDMINEDAVYAIGRAFVQYLGRGKTIVVARDVRLSGPALFAALTQGIAQEGATIIDIGMVTTEMLYFAVAFYGYDAGIMISASHNEGQYNGLKFVREGAKAISSDTGLFEIRDLALQLKSQMSNVKCQVSTKDVLDDYIDYLLRNFTVAGVMKPFHIVANANFGMAGRVLDRLIARGKLPVTVTPFDFEPDGAFPKGKPDPLIPKRREEMGRLVRKEKPDFGVTWDADADRCFFYDEKGEFVDGYYTLCILAEYLLQIHPGGEPIIYDVRQTWASFDTITRGGGKPIMMKPGHSFIKDRMRKEHALFAGENSGHYYFRDFFGVDSGMVPLLLILDILAKSTTPLSAIADIYRKKYPTSGEVNSEVADAQKIMALVTERYHDGTIEKIDGISVEYPEWRFNIRSSNTEPLLRLNLEAKTDALMKEKTAELLALIRG